MHSSLKFIISTLAFGIISLNSQTTPQPFCAVGFYRDEILGQDDYIFQNFVKKYIPKEKWPKVCGQGTSKCGGTDIYFKCVNDTWVEGKCSCPGMTCRKGAQFTQCSGKVTGQPESVIKPEPEPEKENESGGEQDQGQNEEEYQDQESDSKE